MYTHTNFKTKKAFKQAVKAWNERQELTNCKPFSLGAILASTQPDAPAVTVYQPGPFGGNEPTDGEVCIEGPHYPKPHRWYATATLKDGIVVKVK
jgi:hypothetical protein